MPERNKLEDNLLKLFSSNVHVIVAPLFRKKSFADIVFAYISLVNNMQKGIMCIMKWLGIDLSPSKH